MNQKNRKRVGDFAAIAPLENSLPASIAAAVRLVINASEETQITDINVRPHHAALCYVALITLIQSSNC
ncbi:NADP-dependent 3-hydroxy acid dehydrogenase YdfG [Erwinia toletana]|uniref:NADP-dependent 3-hydroxy acid dehydrogenase YdfG n=1 Tax=Winslowiella toletana TaxID=92490 RepID=A0ABS4PFG5_9GAMM|nr:hypothetical protein [Winslowiella toletana]MBP2171375.1 NADP-dependent 3-hydroxy acid dehydrogenase YdfG [Winslowiella toletana]